MKKIQRHDDLAVTVNDAPPLVRVDVSSPYLQGVILLIYLVCFGANKLTKEWKKIVHITAEGA